MTYSILSLKIYRIIESFNLSTIISIIVKIIINYLEILKIPLIIYINFYSL
jgi:hypothetical protein